MKKKILSILGTFLLIIIIMCVGATVFVTRTDMRRNTIDAYQTHIIHLNTIGRAHLTDMHAMFAALFDETASVNITPDVNTCEMGQWLKSDDASEEQDETTLVLIREISALHNVMHGYMTDALALAQAGKRAEAQAMYREQITPASDQIALRMASLAANAQLQADNTRVTALNAYRIGMISSMSVIVVSAFILLIASRRLIRAIVPPLNKLRAAAQGMSQGELELDLDLGKQHKDELGQLADAMRVMTGNIHQQSDVIAKLADGNFNASIPVRSDKDVMNQAINIMLEQNNAMIEDVHTASEQVAYGSAQIAAGAQMLASGSTEQAALIQQLSAVIVQVQQQAQENSELAAQTMLDTEKSNVLMAEGLAQMQATIVAMQAIEHSSGTIAKVIKVIDDIAFQTNILSLNAAVEAARAGVHGKGFAVVADEVRNLAAKSATAAKETAALIEESVKNATAGSDIVVKTSHSLEKVGDIARGSMEQMSRLGDLSKQQSDAINQIRESLDQISIVVQSNSANAEQSAAAAEEISSQSAFLNQIVSQFQLRPDTNELRQG